jgi:hypothetical protein
MLQENKKFRVFSRPQAICLEPRPNYENFYEQFDFAHFAGYSWFAQLGTLPNNCPGCFKFSGTPRPVFTAIPLYCNATSVVRSVWCENVSNNEKGERDVQDSGSPGG